MIVQELPARAEARECNPADATEAQEFADWTAGRLYYNGENADGDHTFLNTNNWITTAGGEGVWFVLRNRPMTTLEGPFTTTELAAYWAEVS